MPSKEKLYSLDFHHFAKEGDEVLNKITRKIVTKYKKRLKKKKSFYKHLYTKMISNEFISNFEVPATFKGLENRTGVKYKGDKVEAWVYFLYINYGEESVERYLIEQWKKVLPYYNK